MKKHEEKDIMDKFEDKMNRVDEILIKRIMETEGKTREEAEAEVKDLNI